MIKFLILFCIFSFTTSSFVYTQSSPGAKHSALSYSDEADESDIFSLFSNPSNLSLIKKRQIGFFYSPFPYGIKELASGHFVYNESLPFGNLAVGAMIYGFELYSENRVVFGYSAELSDHFIFGISTFYHHVKIKGYGNDGTYNINMGGRIKLHSKLLLGFSLHNPIRFANSEIELPLYFNMGISFRPIAKTSIYFAFMKEINFPFSYRAGIEYPLIDFLYLRVGAQNNPNSYSGGFGIQYSFFQLNYSIQSHIDLGLTHQADLILTLN